MPTMTIVELIDHLKSRDLAEKLSSKILPDVDFDMIIIYMKDKVALDSKISFYDFDAISNELIMEVNGEKYEYFFGLEDAQEMVEGYIEEHNPTNLQMAQRMIEYNINDA